jgi:hypothetical protein
MTKPTIHLEVRRPNDINYDDAVAGYMNGQMEILVYNGRLQSSRCLPGNLQRAKAMTKLFAMVLEAYEIQACSTSITD